MTKLHTDDTICAVSTPIGEGGISIIRLSGPESVKIADKVFRPARKSEKLSKAVSHTVKFGTIVASDGNILDEVLVSVFLAPKTYTKEDVVEVNAHGGVASARKILDLLIENGARLAEGGEFTKRAFLNGRIDLLQAEAVLNIIKSKTELALKESLKQLEGGLSGSINDLKERLKRLLAHIEAYIDFPEEDIEVSGEKKIGGEIKHFLDEVRHLIAEFSKGEVLKEGILAVIVGRPNVGKSSLMNALLARDRAIVSDIPGTTRDVLEEMIQIDGIPVRLVDTAGLADSSDPLEKLGIERTRKFLDEGDLFLVILDASSEITDEDRRILEDVKDKNTIVVYNKIDLGERSEKTGTDTNFLLLSSKKLVSVPGFLPVFISCKTKEGFAELEKKISEFIRTKGISGRASHVTKTRHKKILEEAKKYLESAKDAFSEKKPLEFLAVDLREALNRFGELTGEVYTDEILDVVFSEFCIGK